MPGLNLTRREAAQRARVVRVESYEVSLDLRAARDQDETTFPTTTVVRFRGLQPGASTWLDFHGPQVLAVTLNGRDLDPADVVADHRIRLDGLAADNVVTVVARGGYTRSGEGLHRSVDPADGETYLYTQFQLADTRRVLAVFEQPDQKATFAFTVTAPADWVVLGNTAAPPPEPLGDGVARWTFPATPPIPCYVAALVAGPLHGVQATYQRRDGSVVPLGVHCRQSVTEHLDADDVVEVTRQGMAFFEDAFGTAYPFGKYDQVFLPEYNAGAMENAGLVTFSESGYLFRSRVTDAAYETRARYVLHELAHMWFGNLVTMRWWHDLWLNESFADWAAIVAQTEATRWRDAWASFATVEKLWALRADQLPTTHPVACAADDLADVESNFDGITYAKGAAALNQLVAWVGRDAFLAGLRDYFRAHAWGNAELADLFAAVERHCGRDLGAWEKAWIGTAGVSTLRPTVSSDESGRVTAAAVEQLADPAHPTLRPHRIGVGSYDRRDGRLVHRATTLVDLDGSTTSTPLPHLVGQPRPDLLLVNDGDLTYAKVRFDDRSLAGLLGDGLPDEPLARAVCWTALVDMLRCAELPARRFVDVVLAEIGRETSLAVVRTLLTTGRLAVERYADPAASPALVGRWADVMLDLAVRAEAGGDQQLAYAQSWLGTATSADHATLMLTLLDAASEPAIPGLVVDTDLRWRLVERLASLGAVDERLIDTELAADSTTPGQVSAAAARAARPTWAAKEQAWVATTDPDVTNAVLRGTVGSIYQPHQRDLVRPLRDRYFAMLDDVWAQRSRSLADAIVVGLFPRTLAEPATVEAADAWLAADHEPPLRRHVEEGRADVARAVAAQRCDAGAGQEAPPGRLSRA